MSLPTISFLFNNGSSDSVYPGTGEASGDWKLITTATDKLIWTGGGIDDTILTTPTCASGTRSPTIRPSDTPYVIPYLYIESDMMYHVPLAGKTTSRYVMGVYINGTATSNLYLEAWDDQTFSTTASPLLAGSANSSNLSYINAIRTTNQAPPAGWNGSSDGAAYLRGTDYRVPLSVTSGTLTDIDLYYNIYVQLETDSTTFHTTPVLAFRYLYV